MSLSKIINCCDGTLNGILGDLEFKDHLNLAFCNKEFLRIVCKYNPVCLSAIRVRFKGKIECIGDLSFVVSRISNKKLLRLILGKVYM